MRPKKTDGFRKSWNCRSMKFLPEYFNIPKPHFSEIPTNIPQPPKSYTLNSQARKKLQTPRLAAMNRTGTSPSLALNSPPGQGLARISDYGLKGIRIQAFFIITYILSIDYDDYYSLLVAFSWFFLFTFFWGGRGEGGRKREDQKE